MFIKYVISRTSSTSSNIISINTLQQTVSNCVMMSNYQLRWWVNHEI